MKSDQLNRCHHLLVGSLGLTPSRHFLYFMY